MEYISKSEKETYRIAATIADKLKPGDILDLEGDLGSGKTTFTKGLGEALGIKEDVTSPTFVLMKKYFLSKNKNGIDEIVHVDCYRMESGEDAYAIGLVELFDEKKALIILEWAEKIKEVLPNRVRKISFEYIDEGTRKIIVQ